MGTTCNASAGYSRSGSAVPDMPAPVIKGRARQRTTYYRIRLCTTEEDFVLQTKSLYHRIFALQNKTLYERIRLYRSGADSNPSCAGKGAFVGQEGSAKKFPNRLASQRRLLKFSLADLVPHEQVIQNMKGAPDINRPEENQGGELL